jgi:PleD family two-component response regulator
VTASVGIALGGPTCRPGTVLSAADATCYQAKAAGRDRWARSPHPLDRGVA